MTMTQQAGPQVDEMVRRMMASGDHTTAQTLIMLETLKVLENLSFSLRMILDRA